jgi:hypothetical protein
MADLVGSDILDLKYYWWTRAEVAGIPVVVTRTGWSSEVGYEIYLLDPCAGRGALGGGSSRSGEPYGVKPTGPSDIRRIEGGILNWGADMTYENNPLELGLERLVSFGLADEASISIAALRRIREQGVRRRLVGVELDGAAVPGPQQRQVAGRDGWPATSWSAEVTSAIHSPRLQQEHRLLLGARRACGRRLAPARRLRVGPARRYRRADTLRRSRQAHSGVVSRSSARPPGLPAVKCFTTRVERIRIGSTRFDTNH